MSASEILTQFRRLPLAEQREVVLGIREAFENELPDELIAKWEARAERLRRQPETGIAWETIRAERKARRSPDRSCAGK